MKKGPVLKICVDVGMMVALLFLMSYSLIGEKNHEWIGCLMFLLFLMHQILNRAWYRNLFRGRYTVYRIVQTFLVIFMLVGMIGSMVSGIILSRHVFAELLIEGGLSWARTLHMFCGYWGFVIMSLHLGFHWNFIMGMVKKRVKRKFRTRIYIMRGIRR